MLNVEAKPIYALFGNCKISGPSPWIKLSEEELRDYWLYCKEELNWGSATLRI